MQIYAHLTSLVLILTSFGCSTPQAVAPAPMAAAQPLVRHRNSQPGPIVRLNDAVTPLAYRLGLSIDPQQQSFSGVVGIVVKVTQPSREIYLHGQALRVSHVTASIPGHSPLEGTYAQLNDDGLARLTFAEALPAGTATLALQYEADYNTGLDGLYRVGLTDPAGPYVVSQFEPTSARRAFPCFDEPRFKTSFEVTLDVPAAAVAISNMPALGEQSAGTPAGTPTPTPSKKVTFAASPPLPTYLVAFAVGSFDVVEGATLPASGRRQAPIPIRGIAARGQGPKLQYALAHAGRLVELLEDYFNLAYPFAKLDLIAVPDFAAGAMENPGAITFRDWLILLDPNTASRAQKINYASVLSHELVHQWFGDYVTMPWWDDLWLNEAFATWLGNKTTASFAPDMRMPEEVLLSTQEAMRLDALPSVRKIRQPVRSPGDIDNAFDATTYLKGGGVLEMFEGYLGESRMAKAMFAHLQRYRFGNADSAQFLQSLSRSSGVDIASSFSTFLDQPGLPQVRAEVTCDADGARLSLQQSRYIPLGMERDEESLWEIPICWRADYPGAGAKDTAVRHCHLLKSRAEQIELPSCPKWLLPNAAAKGYYRWILDEDALVTLQKAELSPVERLSLQSNRIATLMAGQAQVPDVFAGLQRDMAVHDLYLATAPLNFLRFVNDALLSSAPEAQQQFAAWLRKLYAAESAQLGVASRTDDTPSQELLRPRLLAFLVDVADDAPLRDKLAKAGAAYLGYAGDGALHPEAVDADLVDQAVTAAAETLGEPFIKATFALLERSEDALLRRTLVAALASIKTPAAAAYVRDQILVAKLRQNEVLTFLAQPMQRPTLRATQWQWFVDHYAQLQARLPRKSLHDLPRLAGRFCSHEDAGHVENFFAPHLAELPGAERALAQTLEGIKLCAAQRQAHAGATVQYFAQFAASQAR